MAFAKVKSGALVMLSDLDPSGPYFVDGASLRVTGKLHKFLAETAIATIADGGVTLNVDTQHLRDLSFQVGSIYQFIGELHIEPNNKVRSRTGQEFISFPQPFEFEAVLGDGFCQAILQARIGRNVDGIDLNLYHQSLQLLRQFKAAHMKHPMN